jgi:hypothetical protein
MVFNCSCNIHLLFGRTYIVTHTPCQHTCVLETKLVNGVYVRPFACLVVYPSYKKLKYMRSLKLDHTIICFDMFLGTRLKLPRSNVRVIQYVVCKLPISLQVDIFVFLV